MDIPFEYHPIPASTWAYLSSLLLLTLFFKFNRFWSVRNVDLLLIIALAPGLLFLQGGLRMAFQASLVNTETVEASSNRIFPETAPPAVESNTAPSLQSLEKEAKLRVGQGWQRWGYYWLFAVSGIFLVRMLIDPGLTRRPVLEPNLTSGGLVFFGISLMSFLFANIISSAPTQDDLRGARDAVKLAQRERAQAGDIAQLRKRGPGFLLFNLFPIIPSFSSPDEMLETDPDQEANMQRYVIAAKSLAIASQLLLVLGLILFCYYNYNSFNIGVGVAVIYLMLPYTAIYTGHVVHVLPACLLL